MEQCTEQFDILMLISTPNKLDFSVIESNLSACEVLAHTDKLKPETANALFIQAKFGCMVIYSYSDFYHVYVHKVQ